MTSSHRILVVDDNADFRYLICHWLKHAGYDVRAAQDAFEALSILENDPTIDLTLSDFDMPQATGIDLRERLRAIGVHLPFVLATANATIERSELERAGIDGFLAKPFSSAALLRCIQSHLKKSPRRFENDAEKAS